MGVWALHLAKSEWVSRHVKVLLLPWVCCCPSEPVRRRFRTVLQGVEPTVTLLRLLNEIGAIQTRPAEPFTGL